MTKLPHHGVKLCWSHLELFEKTGKLEVFVKDVQVSSVSVFLFLFQDGLQRILITQTGKRSAMSFIFEQEFEG